MSHKTKGQKVDLAAFYSAGDDMMLPSAPDPNREPYDRRKGRGEGRGGGRGFNDRGDRNERNDRNDRGPRNRNYGDNEGGDRNDRNDRGGNDGPSESDSGPWQRAGPSGRTYRDSGRDYNNNRDNNRDYNNRDYNNRDNNRYGNNNNNNYKNSESSAPLSERPTLNLQPRTIPLPEPSVESVTSKVETLSTKESTTPSSVSTTSTTASGSTGDKWDNVFSKSKFQGGSSDARKNNNYGDRDRERDRPYNDRGDNNRGYNDRNRDRPYNDRRNGGGSGNYGDRNGDRDRDRGYNDRRGYGSSSNRYETDPEPIDDPRFVGKFGNSRPSSDSRNSSKSSTPASVSIPTVVVQEKKEDPKAEIKKAAQEEKAQRAAAKAEAEKKAKADKLSKKERELAELEQQKTIANELVASGVKGQSLLDNINNAETKPNGPALVAAILPSLPSIESLSWVSLEEYGISLQSLLNGKDREQMMVIYELQKYCHKNKFPKIQTKNGQKSLYELTIQLLFKNEILESSGILKWWDDEEFDDIPGRSDALVQLTTFVNWLNEVDEEDEEEEDNYEGLEPAPRNAA